MATSPAKTDAEGLAPLYMTSSASDGRSGRQKQFEEKVLYQLRRGTEFRVGAGKGTFPQTASGGHCGRQKQTRSYTKGLVAEASVLRG